MSDGNVGGHVITCQRCYAVVADFNADKHETYCWAAQRLVEDLFERVYRLEPLEP